MRRNDRIVRVPLVEWFATSLILSCALCLVAVLVIVIAITWVCLCAGLPPSGSWQDLKDHMREAGDVCYADAFKDGTGVVEFLRKEDMKYAVRKLDDTKFRSHEVGVTAFISPSCVSLLHLQIK